MLRKWGFEKEGGDGRIGGGGENWGLGIMGEVRVGEELEVEGEELGDGVEEMGIVRGRGE